MGLEDQARQELQSEAAETNARQRPLSALDMPDLRELLDLLKAHSVPTVSFYSVEYTSRPVRELINIFLGDALGSFSETKPHYTYSAEGWLVGNVAMITDGRLYAGPMTSVQSKGSVGLHPEHLQAGAGAAYVLDERQRCRGACQPLRDEQILYAAKHILRGVESGRIPTEDPLPPYI